MVRHNEKDLNKIFRDGKAHLINSSETIGPDSRLDLDKSWHALHYLLCGGDGMASTALPGVTVLLTCTKKGHNKFYEVTVDGQGVQSRYGAINGGICSPKPPVARAGNGDYVNELMDALRGKLIKSKGYVLTFAGEASQVWEKVKQVYGGKRKREGEGEASQALEVVCFAQLKADEARRMLEELTGDAQASQISDTKERSLAICRALLAKHRPPQPEEPRAYILQGGKTVVANFGMGPLRMLSSEQVKLFNQALQEEDDQKVFSRFDPEVMNSKGLMGISTFKQEDAEYLKLHLAQLRAFVAEAAQAGEAIALYLS